jgi:hypothetical protein
MSGTYLRFPLALLRSSSSATGFFNDAAGFAAVNAGIGARRGMNPQTWKMEVTKLTGYTKSEEARIGAALCKITLGDTTGESAFNAYKKILSDGQGSPVVSVASNTFWSAGHTQRFEDGDDEESPERRISWREFRILVALSSLVPNSKGFAVAGWESISHRACGFHKKDDFRAFESSPEPWPDHCIPMTRYQTTSTLERLESLRFFIRHRISRADRGGMTAYSFRHDRREALAKDCEEWQAFNRGEQVRETRSEDQLLHAKRVAERETRIRKNRSQAASILETCKPPEISPPAKPLPALVQDGKQPPEPLKDSKPASDLQVTSKAPASLPARCLQGTLQHNEKCSSEKYLSEKSPNEKCVSEESAQALGREQEEGYLFEGRFLGSEDANRILIQFPDSFSSFKRAQRITRPDGSQSMEESP